MCAFEFTIQDSKSFRALNLRRKTFKLNCWRLPGFTNYWSVSDRAALNELVGPMLQNPELHLLECALLLNPPSSDTSQILEVQLWLHLDI